MKRKYKGHQVTYHQKPGCLPCGDNSVSELEPCSFEARGTCLEGRNSTTELLPPGLMPILTSDTAFVKVMPQVYVKTN